MKYDFSSIPDRTNTGSAKWNAMKDASVERVPLSVADMEFYTAPAIKEAIKNLVDTQILGYTEPTDEYFDAVCSWMMRRHHFEVKKEWMIQTPGVVDALAILIEASTKPGDGVIVLTPVYYPFDMAVIAKDRHIVYSELINNNGHYEINFSDLSEKAKNKKNTALLFCNPHNPIGRVWTREELQKVADICCENNVFIIDDEIHNDLIMPGYEHTVLPVAAPKALDHCAVCTAPSKTFNLAGLQCSNIIIHDSKIRTKASACSLLNMQMHLNVISYTACIAAYNECEDWLDELIEMLDGNAKYIENFMAENFPEIKISPLEGTYLLWLDMRGLGMTHTELKTMLEKAGLCLDYGEMFGAAGRGFERINLACARLTLERAMERFKAAVEEVRSQWETDGKPYHKTLVKGGKLEEFIYDSTLGKNRMLASAIEKNTLIVFARYYECAICRKILSALKAAYPTFKMIKTDIKVVLQSDMDVIAKAQKDYPFELIADPKAKLYDKYNIFEADSMVNMIAGDKIFELLTKKGFKRLLDSDLVGSLESSMNSSPEEEENTDKKRELQMFAFVGVNKNMDIIYSHYCKTIGDIPNIPKMLSELKK